MFKMDEYDRKSFRVHAVQITNENIAHLAVFCKGRIGTGADGTKYIQIYLEPDAPKRQTVAYVGDWVLRSRMGVRFYKNKSFQGVFEPAVSDEEKFNQVLLKVQQAMHTQDAATYDGEASSTAGVSEKTAREILDLFK